MAQVKECLLSKCEALGLIASPAKVNEIRKRQNKTQRGASYVKPGLHPLTHRALLLRAEPGALSLAPCHARTREPCAVRPTVPKRLHPRHSASRSPFPLGRGRSARQSVDRTVLAAPPPSPRSGTTGTSADFGGQTSSPSATFAFPDRRSRGARRVG
jgi:hypothetical protein